MSFPENIINHKCDYLEDMSYFLKHVKVNTSQSGGREFIYIDPGTKEKYFINMQEISDKFKQLCEMQNVKDTSKTAGKILRQINTLNGQTNPTLNKKIKDLVFKKVIKSVRKFFGNHTLLKSKQKERVLKEESLKDEELIAKSKPAAKTQVWKKGQLTKEQRIESRMNRWGELIKQSKDSKSTQDKIEMLREMKEIRKEVIKIKNED